MLSVHTLLSAISGRRVFVVPLFGSALAGVAAQAQSKFDEAQAHFERARALKPQAIEPLAALARLQIARNQPAKAIVVAQQGADADPKNAPTLILPL